MTVAKVRALVDGAGHFEPEPPRPLRRELPPPEGFPVEALGRVLAPAARAIHERIQAPIAICAQSVLAAATLTVQPHADVVLPFGQRRPLSGYWITVAESGERKTSVDAEALRPIRQFESRLHAGYGPAFAEYENRRAAWDAVRKRIVGDRKLGREAKEQELADLGPSPEPPLLPLLTCPEPTYEGMTKLFAVGRPSLGLFSNEGGQFIGGYGMSPDNRLKTAAGLSGLWDGEPLRRVRSGDGAVMLPGRRLALHLMVQPHVASSLLADAMLADQGLLSRLLVAAPASTAGTRLWREPSSTSASDLQRYDDQLLDLLEAPLPLEEGTMNQLRPRRLPFSPRAREVWIKFHDHIEGQLASGGALEPVRAFGAKAAEHAARLAAVLALVEDLDSPQLDSRHLDAGIDLMNHYAFEWLRLHDIGATSPELARAERLLQWIGEEWAAPVIGLPEVYQLGPNSVRDARTAREAMAVLEEHGWVSPIDGGADVEGVHRREAWRIASPRGAGQ